MSSGRYHRWKARRNAVLVMAATAAPAYWAWEAQVMGWFLPAWTGMACGLLLGVRLSPDVDTWVWPRRLRRVGPRIWYRLWEPFVRLPHRGPMTHSWPLGTVLRFLWLMRLLSPVIIIALALGMDWRRLLLGLLAGFVGLSLQDVQHLIDDGLGVTGVANEQRVGRKQRIGHRRQGKRARLRKTGSYKGAGDADHR